MSTSPSPARKTWSPSSVTILRDNPLGRGAFGRVYKAFDNATGQYLAVKECDVPHNTGTIFTLKAEFDTLAGLKHPHIVSVLFFELDTANEVGRIYMEWLPGGSLGSVAKSVGGIVHEAAIRAYMRDALSGLAYLHEHGIVHRDVKPANLLLGPDGRAKLSDFGTRKLVGTSSATQTTSSGGIAGTPVYMDAASLQGRPSPASDIWALGCTIVELSSGRPPWAELDIDEPLPLMFHICFQAQPPAHHPAVPTHLSAALLAVLQRCFAHLPENRPSAQELLADPYFDESSEVDDMLMESLRDYESRVATNSFAATPRSGAPQQSIPDGSQRPSDALNITSNLSSSNQQPTFTVALTSYSSNTFSVGATDTGASLKTDGERVARMLGTVENLPDSVAELVQRRGAMDAADLATASTPSDPDATAPSVGLGEYLSFDDKGQLTRMQLPSLSLVGSVRWTLLPNATHVDLSGNSLDGRVDLVARAGASLVAMECYLSSPWQRLDRLQNISIQCNALSGPFNLSLLPPNLRELNLRSNNFTGPLTFTGLPQTLTSLDCSRNSFSGYVDLRHLPPGLKELNVSNNNLSGPLDLSALPPVMEFLHLNNNHFIGVVDLSAVPASMKHISCFSNRLGPPGHKAQYGTGLRGVPDEIVLYFAKKRIRSMDSSRRDDPQLQTPPEEEERLLAQAAALFPAGTRSLSVHLGANAFRFPMGLSGVVRLGGCQLHL
jgi:serine/threonine protein kinase